MYQYCNITSKIHEAAVCLQCFPIQSFFSVNKSSERCLYDRAIGSLLDVLRARSQLIAPIPCAGVDDVSFDWSSTIAISERQPSRPSTCTDTSRRCANVYITVVLVQQSLSLSQKKKMLRTERNIYVSRTSCLASVCLAAKSDVARSLLQRITCRDQSLASCLD